MKSVILLGHRRVLWGTVMAACLVTSLLVPLSSANAVAVNPVPYVSQPLVPDAAPPGGPGFTLTVNGTGFVSGSVVNWNGSARATHFVSEGQLTAAILATDIAKAGTASITVVNTGPGGGTSGAIFFPVATPEASVSFARTDYSSPGGNIQMVTADFNGDGKLDLATATYYDSTVRIFLGNGDGTFRTGPTYAACNAGGLATGDFNGDGIVDLVVSDDGCGEVTILLGNGDGTFRVGGNFATGGSGIYAPYSVAVGDFNGDGKLDLATANELENTLSVLLGNGDGTFQTHVDYDTVGDCRQVATGDFNGDGKLDLVVSSGSYNRVSVLLGNGDGTFQAQAQYQVNGSNNPYLIVADLNRDGKLDLAVASDDGWVFILLGDGDGTFRTGGTYTTGAVSNWVRAGDFNGDGILDLITSNYGSSSISLFLGNGDGTFQAPVTYGAGDGARGIAVGDFNGDGRLDLAVGNQFVDSISIYLQTTGGPVVSLSPASLTFLLLRTVGTTSSTQTVKLTNVGSGELDISGITLTGPDPGDFAQSNNCPPTVASGGSCLITVTFTPTTQRLRTASVSITDSVPGSPQTVPLTGRGTFFEWSPRSLNMGDQKIGTSIAARTVTLTNAGPAPITIYSIEIAGVNAGDFTQTNTCGSSLKAEASCTIQVTFTPTAVGSRLGHVAIRDSAFGGTHWVGLLGKGT
jgi:FG-GAP-like repeat